MAGESFLIFSGSETPVQTNLSVQKLDLKPVKKSRVVKKLASQKKKKVVRKLKKSKVTKSDSTDVEDEEEEDLRDITEFLTLPKNFKPKTLKQMENPNKVFFLKKRGTLSTFPLTYISKLQKREYKKLQMDKLKSKTISKGKISKKRKKRFNPFEGPKGVKIPKLSVNWSAQSPTSNFVGTFEAIQRSKQLNMEGSMSFMKVFSMHRYSKAIQSVL